MDPLPTIRAERSGDALTIAEVVFRAYADVAYSDRREHEMVARLRESRAFVPGLSLLAEVGGTAIGHILLTRAEIGSGPDATTTLALAPPLSRSGRSGQGVGKCLVREAHRRAAELGFRSIVLVGLPDYYPQFGYERLSAYPITLPFDTPDANCMVLPLTLGALDHVSGQVRYPDAWLNH